MASNLININMSVDRPSQGEFFKRKGGGLLEISPLSSRCPPVTNFILYSKMVYSALLRLAVRERFELPDPFGSSVFKTDGLSHSPTLPFTDALHSESAHIHILLAFAIYSSTLKASDVDVSPNNLFMCSVASLSE